MENKVTTTDFWRLNSHMASLTSQLIENGGELTEDLEQVFNTIQWQQAEMADGLQSMVAYAKEQEDALKSEIKRLQDLKKSRTQCVETIKRYMVDYMTAHNIEAIDGQFCHISLRKSPESVDFIEDDEIAPYRKAIEEFAKTLPPFIKIEASVLSTPLKEWLRNGGVTAGAALNNTKKTLSIK